MLLTTGERILKPDLRRRMFAGFGNVGAKGDVQAHRPGGDEKARQRVSLRAIQPTAYVFVDDVLKCASHERTGGDLPRDRCLW